MMVNLLEDTRFCRFFAGATATVLLMLTTACSSIPPAARVEMPTATVVGTRIVGINAQEVRVDLMVQIVNPNPFVLHNIGAVFDVSVEGKTLLNLEEIQFDAPIAARGTADVTIPLVFQLKSVLALIPQAMATNALEYRVRGDIVVPVPLLGKLRVPVTHQGVIPIPKPPTVSLTSISVGSMSLSKVSLDIVMDLYNPNSFDIKSLSGDYAVSFNQAVAGRIEVNTGTLLAEQTGQVRLVLDLSPLTIGLGTMQSNNWLVELKGKTRWQPYFQDVDTQISDLLLQFDWSR